MKLAITNTMSGLKQIFVPHADKTVTMYVCGITPYDYAHIGHGRCYVVFDLLYRVLNLVGYKVVYCRNFTDIDDKILNRAHKELGSAALYLEIANRYIEAFNENMKSLDCIKPDYEPRVTTTIPEIITFIEGLIKKGHAYVVAGDVYYNVPSFPKYGELSKRTLDELYVGARVEVNELKKSPYDFALWKEEDEGTFWKSPWGYGRPGWHIECSAMSKQYLDYPIDIHGGGMDLIFPHHENENAQSLGLYKEFVCYWVHSAFITVNKEKMSKSLDNFITLNDVFKRYDPMVLRYYYLNHYFRAPLEFSWEDLESSSKSYNRLCLQLSEHQCSSCAGQLSIESLAKTSVAKKMISFLLDDLNVAGMFGVLFESLPELKKQEAELCVIKRILHQVMGFSLKPLVEEQVELTPEIKGLIAQREEARKMKDWTRADAIRDQLVALGYKIHDIKLKS